jgi:outer membrane protein assembly factor BamB
MYERAAAKRDMNALAAVAQDYLLTEAGKKACLLLSDLCIEKAEYSLALHYLDTIANYHYCDSEEPALCVLKRAACLLQSSEMDTAKRMLTVLEGKTLNEVETRIYSCLLEMAKSPPYAKKNVFNSYYDGFVNLKTPPSVKLVEKAGKEELDALDWRFHVDRKVQPSTGRGYGITRIMADGMMGFDLFPVYYNNLLFINDSSRIYALAADGGKIKWREPDEDTSKIDGLPLGCFVHDGRLFAVLRNTKSYTKAFSRRGGAPAAPAVNELYCFNADKFGENPPEWHTGSMRDSTDLKETSFTSVPYVDGSRVYFAGVEVTDQDQNYSVCCFSTSGNFLWETRFCATKWTGQQSLLRAASLIVTRGKVVVCTNIGVAAALSAFTGEMEWIYKYPLQAAANNPANRGFTRSSPLTWQPMPPIAWYGTHPADGKLCEALVLTPGDSDFILGFDMAARKLLWRWERTRHSFVIGPRGEDIFVYGGASLEDSSNLVVRQHRIPDGLIRWEAKLPPEAFDPKNPTAFSKGVATPNALYIPCSKQLLKIVDGKDEKRYFGKVSKAATWYSMETEDADTTEKPPQPGVPRGVVIIGGRWYPGQPRVQPDESRLWGNLLLLPDRIITSGYLYTNCFKLQEKKKEKEKEKEKEK